MNALAHIDFETYSELNVKDVGAYRYAMHPSTEVLICGWRIGSDPVRPWLPWHKPIPLALAQHVENGGKLAAHNAQFERAIWTLVLAKKGKAPPAQRNQWVCTAARAAVIGLPRSLEMAAKALKLRQQKDTEGGKLIKLFCQPQKQRGGKDSIRIMPRDRPAEFKRFIEYCMQDVETEYELDVELPQLDSFQERMWQLDIRMNERGLPIDIPLVKRSLAIITELEVDIRKRTEELTGGIHSTQRDKFLEVLNGFGADIENLQAKTVERLFHKTDDPVLRELLDLRIEASRASTKKLKRMLMATCPDGRARGMFLLFGAHTGRYAGKIIQPQNFIRGTLKPHQQEQVFKLLQHGDPDIFRAMYARPVQIISQCMRGFIAAPAGKCFDVADYKAIEARILAWVADEKAVLDAYRKGLDVYKRMAALLWHIPYDKVSNEQRRIGKNLVLGCGYGLGAPNFILYCAKEDLIIDEELSNRAVYTYRDKHPAIVALWGKVERAAVQVVRQQRTIHNPIRIGRLCFFMKDRWLCIMLPSGRCLHYLNPRVANVVKFDRPKLELQFQVDFRGHIVYESTYGGKLVENIIQAIAFDVMANGMANADHFHAPLVGTVHDEIITENDHHDKKTIKALEEVICKMPAWAEGIPLEAEGFVCTPRYRKN